MWEKNNRIEVQPLSLTDVQRHLKVTPLERAYVSLFGQAPYPPGRGVRANLQCMRLESTQTPHLHGRLVRIAKGSRPLA